MNRAPGPSAVPRPLNPKPSRGWPWRLPWWHGRRSVGGGGAKISVIIPSYNQGRFLEATLRSVLLQPYANVECIVIDGGSTDESVEVIRHYERHLAYWVSERDQGQAHAVNKGLAAATGELRGFLNSDDLHLPWTLSRVAHAAAKEPEAVLFYGDRFLLDADGGVVGWSRNPPFDPEKTLYSICSETAFWRRSAELEVGEFNEKLRFALDVDYFLRLYRAGTIRHLDEALGCFRCHAESKSMTIFNEVGLPEAARCWEEHLGRQEIAWADRPRGDSWAHRRQLLRYPMSLLLPYLSQRVRRAINFR